MNTPALFSDITPLVSANRTRHSAVAACRGVGICKTAPMIPSPNGAFGPSRWHILLGVCCLQKSRPMALCEEIAPSRIYVERETRLAQISAMKPSAVGRILL
jgi:hypothetical protein